MNSKFVAFIRSKKDGTIFSPRVIESVEEFNRDIAIFIGQHPATSFAIFPEDYELGYVELDYGASSVLPMPAPAKPKEDE